MSTNGAGGAAPYGNGRLSELLEIVEDGPEEFLLERLQRLEDAILGWDLLSSEGQTDFSRDALGRIATRARLFYLSNPWIKRGVELKRYYVFGQGVSIEARDELVNEVVQAWWGDHRNQSELTSPRALAGQDARLSIDGNLFFALFTNRMTGRVLVRSIPFAEITEVVSDPEDRATPWYYRRRWTQAPNPLAGERIGRPMEAFYPDWKHDPVERPALIDNKPVIWDTPVYHVKAGGLPDMTFGVPEVYAALDWAKAYQRSLEDDAKRSAALARFIWKLVVPGGQQRIDAAKSKLGTTRNPSAGVDETNPPPAGGSVSIVPKGQDFEPIRIAGATLDKDHNRALRLAVCAALGIPETFMGDADVGNLATAKSLDRPSELAYAERQELWTRIVTDLARYAVERNALAPLGKLKGRFERDPFDPSETRVVLAVSDERIDVDFPQILEADMVEYVGALKTAATLDGQTPAGTIDLTTLRKMLLVALKENDVDELLDEIAANLAAEDAQRAAEPQPEEEEPLRVAVRELKEAVAALAVVSESDPG